MGRGLFIAFEGIDGSGKSTQLELFLQWLARADIEPVAIREPGGTPLGEAIRRLLLEVRDGAEMQPAAEALLYAASRAELVATTIEPALAAGRLVVADRFVDSSLAYQGAGRELGIERVAAVNELATGRLAPDVVVLVRLDPAAALQRRRAAAGDGGDRIERAPLEFFERAASAYDAIAAAAPERHLVVDGARAPGEIHDEIVRALTPRLEGAGLLASPIGGPT